MIRIKFEVEEEEVTPIENENERIKGLLSLKFVGNNSNNVGGGSTSDINNVFRTLKEPPQKLPENNVVVSKKKKKKKKPKLKLDNSTTDSVVAVGSKSIKTEPAESLSTTFQILKQSTEFDQSIQQQQQHSFLLPKIEPIAPDNQEVPLSLDLSSSSIPDLNSGKTSNCNITTEIFPGDISEIHQEVPLSLDHSSLFPNLNSEETTSTATNCDITATEMFSAGPRAGLSRRAKLNVCYSVPKKPKPEVPRRRKMVPNTPPTLPKGKCGEYQRKQWKTQNRMNLAAAQNSESNQNSGSGSISVFDPSISSTTEAVAAPSPQPEAAVPLLVGKKPLPLGIPPLTSLEEKNARKREYNRLRYRRQKAIPKQPLDPEVRAEKLRQRREYSQKCRQQLLATGTPEQLELIRLKDKERSRRFLEKESEEQRKQRLEEKRQYDRTVRKQKIQKQKRKTMTPEERGKDAIEMVGKG